ncbi:hypothetical protein [Hominenteromicrobium sp.]|uniref:hypothetical protein n=1 Tax=Hominenteromicrobium sp. TaxID=3073581 RepID=UPI003AB8FB1B
MYGLIFKIFCKIPQKAKILRKPPSSIAPQRSKPFEKACTKLYSPVCTQLHRKTAVRKNSHTAALIYQNFARLIPRSGQT